jgi:primary-amine oxidase
MTISQSCKPSSTQPILHPLEPLSVEEITAAVGYRPCLLPCRFQFRFPTVVLNEPPKEVVLNFKEGDPIEREAFLILLDNATGTTYEAVVSLNQGTVTSWQAIPGVQPNIMADELAECEAAVKAHPDFQAVLKQRGITNLDLVMVDPWAVGNFGFEEEEESACHEPYAGCVRPPTATAMLDPLMGSCQL